MCRLLTASDISVEAYSSGYDFLDSLPRAKPDCLVLDLQMPGMSGFELQRRLLRDGVRLPIVIITAHDEPGARLRCVSAGAAAFLTKPLNADTLIDAIHAAVRSVTLH